MTSTSLVASFALDAGQQSVDVIDTGQFQIVVCQDLQTARPSSPLESGTLREADVPGPTAALFQRHPLNPILTAQDWPYPAHTAFNAGACQIGDETILLVRVQDNGGHSHMSVARSHGGTSD